MEVEYSFTHTVISIDYGPLASRAARPMRLTLLSMRQRARS